MDKALIKKHNFEVSKKNIETFSKVYLLIQLLIKLRWKVDSLDGAIIR